MATYAKRRLSGSTDGQGIIIQTTAATGTLIHTSISGTSASGSFDEVWVWANNTATASKVLGVQWGAKSGENGVTVRFTLPSRDGAYLIIPGWILQNSRIVRAFATTTGVVTMHGYVNRIA